ncbi:hypothetical protein [uncultured Aquimarina sp.]|uniref:hypothetical protein n=1 Tax=uncultured Aquimarina sp. TaxID=575652 RepID=UPI002638DF3D|nr:hypothetical protein [uncultured Aquimarina sp.]
MSNGTITNEAPPKETIIEVGKPKHLRCDYFDPLVQTCQFKVYRKDHKDLDGQPYFILSASGLGSFRSDTPVKPKFTWFDKNEEEIKLVFDVIFSDKTIPCTDQILIIKKGNSDLNVYWEGGEGEMTSSPLRVFAEFSIHSNLDIGNKILFKIDRTQPKDYYSLASNQKVYEELRTTKNDIVTIRSEPIDTDYFFKWFCVSSLNISFIQGFRDPVIYLKDIEQKKIRRSDPVNPEDIYKILQADGLVPQIFYDYHLTTREFLAPFDWLHGKLSTVVNITQSAIKKSFKNFFKNYAKSKLEGAATTDVFKRWIKNRNNYRFYKEELKELIDYFETHKGKRYTNGFRAWFKLEYGQNPQDPQVKKEINQLKTERQHIWNNRITFPGMSLFESDHSSWLALKKIDKIIKDYNRINQIYNDYEKKFYEIEKKTVEGIKSMIELSPNSNKY